MQDCFLLELCSAALPDVRWWQLGNLQMCALLQLQPSKVACTKTAEAAVILPLFACNGVPAGTGRIGGSWADVNKLFRHDR
jgi:hypothetical protein